MKNYTAFLLALLLLLASCIKDDTGLSLALPAKTQLGQHSFGFLLNNAVWTNYGKVCFLFSSGCRENLRGTYFPSDGDINIAADQVFYKNNSLSSEENFDLNLSTNFRGAGTYSTLSNDTLNVFYSRSEPGQPDKTYSLSASKPDFTVVITKIDPLLKTMSGEFSGKLFRRINAETLATSSTDSIVVSEGRFDIRLK